MSREEIVKAYFLYRLYRKDHALCWQLIDKVNGDEKNIHSIREAEKYFFERIHKIEEKEFSYLMTDNIPLPEGHMGFLITFDYRRPWKTDIEE